MAVIVDAGMREMLVDQRDVFYYITVMNESYGQPTVPQGDHADLLRGCYRLSGWQTGPSTDAVAKAPAKAKPAVTLLGSGAILLEVIAAARELLAQGFEVEVFSVTSWSELARDGMACEAQLLAGETAATPFIASQLASTRGPIIAATDYVRAVPESVRAFMPEGRRYLTLGTDGFGRSDTRAALREFFGVDRAAIVRAARALQA